MNPSNEQILRDAPLRWVLRTGHGDRYTDKEPKGEFADKWTPLYTHPAPGQDADQVRDALIALVNLDRRCGWHSKEQDAAVAALVASEPDNSEIAFNAQRLRNVLKLTGVGDPFPDSDFKLVRAMGAVLGDVARALRVRVDGTVPSIRHWNDGSPPVDWTPEAVQELHAVLDRYPTVRKDPDFQRLAYELRASSIDELGAALSAMTTYIDEASVCPACRGSGESTVMDGGGPDAREIPCNCSHCGGTGGLLDAYNGVVVLLRAKVTL